MTLSILMGGLAQIIQIVPLNSGGSGNSGFAIHVVYSTTISYLGLGVLLLNGLLFNRFGPKNSIIKSIRLVLASGVVLLGLTYAAMAGFLGSLADHLANLQLCAIGFFILTGIFLNPELKPRVLRFLKLGLTECSFP